MEIQHLSILTCPHCEFSEELVMPLDACQFFHVCSSCDVRLKPKVEDCCVFCSYGSLPCPPIQLQALTGTQASCCHDTTSFS